MHAKRFFRSDFRRGALDVTLWLPSLIVRLWNRAASIENGTARELSIASTSNMTRAKNSTYHKIVMRPEGTNHRLINCRGKTRRPTTMTNIKSFTLPCVPDPPKDRTRRSVRLHGSGKPRFLFFRPLDFATEKGALQSRSPRRKPRPVDALGCIERS